MPPVPKSNCRRLAVLAVAVVVVIYSSKCWWWSARHRHCTEQACRLVHVIIIRTHDMHQSTCLLNPMCYYYYYYIMGTFGYQYMRDLCMLFCIQAAQAWLDTEHAQVPHALITTGAHVLHGPGCWIQGHSPYSSTITTTTTTNEDKK